MLLDSLTERQNDVMELAAQHKRNKVIAQELGISPSTVEQRMGYVRDKLGTHERDSTVRRYVELRSICGKPIYGFSHLEPSSISSEAPHQENSGPIEFLAPSFLEILDARFGRWGRIGLIMIGFLGIAIGLLVALAVSNSLTDLISAMG